MSIADSIVADATAWRRDVHRRPEPRYDAHRTARLLAERLRGFGCDEVAEG